ncbi:DEgenerin Like [Brachionus plicatilis]|uniref:DEgenerin Like n=1 Tax=Brachionus plicatilis TaxID=10195 RepID=A0A3M7QTD1_BRAPC|nr:DEgenerin Like [Brachionus plicatilis]
MVSNEINQNKKPTNLSLISNSLKRKCADSTAHGFPRIFDSDLLMIKIIWSIIFSIGIFGAITMIFISIRTYYSYPYSTSVEIYESYLDDFPAVSICNLNPFDTTDPRTQVYLAQILNMSNLSLEINPSSQSPAIYEVRRAFKLLNTNFLDDLRARNFRTDFKIVNNFDDLVLSCYFNGQKCDSTDFQSFFSFGYGQCFTFNKKINDSTSLKKTSKTGPESGLSLELFTGFPGGQQDFLNEKRGILLVAHNNSANPALRLEGIKLPVGTSAEIGIKRTFYKKLSEPFSKCVINASEFRENDSESYKQTVLSGSYTKKKCFENCLQFKFIIPKCNCSDPQISTTNTIGFCKTSKQIVCVEEVRKQFDSEDLSLTCDKECPVSCDTMQYSYQKSYSDYPTQYYYEIIKKQDNLKNRFENSTFDSFKQSTLMVNVFYEELSLTFIKETRLINLQDLVASIGGLLGLFLGCSVLTLMEPIAFVIELVCELFMLKNQTNSFQTKVQPF